MRRSGPTLLALLWTTASCAAGEIERGAVEIRDSAGVRIVDNRVDERAIPVYGEVGELELEIGLLEGDSAYVFGSIWGVAALEHGGVIVSDVQARELRVFDSDGVHATTFGGEGDGPGEFRLVSLLDVRADTVWAWDARTLRVTKLRTDGTLLGTTTLGNRAANGLAIPDRLGDGSYIGRFRGSADTVDGCFVIRLPSPVRHVNATGSVLNEVSVLPGFESAVQLVQEGTVISRGGPRPFGRSSYLAITDDRVVLGSNDTYRVEVWSPSGDLRTVINVLGLERPVDPAELDALRREAFASAPESRREFVRCQFDEIDPPGVLPAFSDLLTDSEALVWVGEYEPVGTPPSGWHVFTLDGQLLGRVETPVGLTVEEVGADYVLGVFRDELDVQYVRRYSFERF